MIKELRIVSVATCALFLGTGEALPQPPGSGPLNSVQESDTRGKQALPKDALYKHFLAHVRQLDSEADQLDQSGKDGSKHRRYYQDRLQFSDLQMAQVRAAVQKMKRADVIDQRASQVIAEFRKELAKRSSAGDSSLPPVPEELRSLKQQRDQLLSNSVSELKDQLGEKASATLDHLIQADFGTHTSMKPVVAPEKQAAKGRDLSLQPLQSAPAQ